MSMCARTGRLSPTISLHAPAVRAVRRSPGRERSGGPPIHILESVPMIRLTPSPARIMKSSAVVAALAAALAGFGPGADAGDGPPRGNVTWQDASSDADIDKAFAAAKAQNKPVFLYWG